MNVRKAIDIVKVLYKFGGTCYNYSVTLWLNISDSIEKHM